MEFYPSHDFEYYRALKQFLKQSYVKDNYSLVNLFSVQNLSKLKKHVSELLSKFDTSSIISVPICSTQAVFDRITSEVSEDFDSELPYSMQEQITEKSTNFELNSASSSDVPNDS